MSCLKELAVQEKRWEYVFTLNSHDVQIKTNEEVVQIFKWLDGACDAEYNIDNEDQKERLDALNVTYNWTLEYLNIFKNGNFNYFYLKL